MDHKTYQKVRATMRETILTAKQANEVAEAFGRAVGELSENQVYDLYMLVSSTDGMRIIYHLMQPEHPLDFSYESLMWVSGAALMLHKSLDFEKCALAVREGPVFDVMMQYGDVVRRSVPQGQTMGEKELFETTVQVIARAIGAYVGECILTKEPESYWDYDFIKTYPTQLSSLKLTRTGMKHDYNINPVGKVWKNIVDGADEDAFLGVQLMFAAWQKLDDQPDAPEILH